MIIVYLLMAAMLMVCLMAGNMACDNEKSTVACAVIASVLVTIALYIIP